MKLGRRLFLKRTALVVPTAIVAPKLIFDYGAIAKRPRPLTLRELFEQSFPIVTSTKWHKEDGITKVQFGGELEAYYDWNESVNGGASASKDFTFYLMSQWSA